MWPCNTVMDLVSDTRPCKSVLMFPQSLANALYFASRGVGVVKGIPYTSPARVLLNGLGADELLGGYGRHRTAFNNGWSGVVDELQLEIDRLPTRNLGRDDRLVSDHGREARHPFLDPGLVQLLLSLPLPLITDLTLVRWQ